MSSREPRVSAPILDPEVIDGLRELGGAELLGELVELFGAEAPGYCDEITSGCESGDVKRVQHAAHTLKSSSANLGATGLSSLARTIESAAKATDMDLLSELRNSLPEVYRETVEALSGLKR